MSNVIKHILSVSRYYNFGPGEVSMIDGVDISGCVFELWRSDDGDYQIKIRTPRPHGDNEACSIAIAHASADQKVFWEICNGEVFHAEEFSRDSQIAKGINYILQNSRMPLPLDLETCEDDECACRLTIFNGRNNVNRTHFEWSGLSAPDGFEPLEMLATIIVYRDMSKCMNWDDRNEFFEYDQSVRDRLVENFDNYLQKVVECLSTEYGIDEDKAWECIRARYAKPLADGTEKCMDVMLESFEHGDKPESAAWLITEL